MSFDYYSEVGKVRLKIGDMTEPYYLENNIIAMVLEDFQSDTASIRIWKASLECLQIMIGQAANQGSRLREREGGVEIEEYRGERLQALKDRYNELVASPPEDLVIESGTIIIGGVSKKETKRVKSPDDAQYSPIGIGWFDKDPY